jgi:hypothetical protein
VAAERRAARKAQEDATPILPGGQGFDLGVGPQPGPTALQFAPGPDDTTAASRFAQFQEAAAGGGIPVGTEGVRFPHRQRGQSEREFTNEFKGVLKFMLKEKLVPKSYDDAAQALDAILSFDRQKLIDAPGTLVPELMVSLTVIPGAVQALRDVVMDVGAGDTGYLTVLAGAGAIPLVGPALKGLRGAKLTALQAKGVRAAIEAGQNFTVLTAGSPMNKTLTAAENAVRNAALERELTEMGVAFTKGVSQYPAEGKIVKDDVFTVFGLTDEQRLALGRKHGQARVATEAGLLHMDDGTVTPARGLRFLKEGETAKAMTVFEGGPAFTMDIQDWDLRLPAEQVDPAVMQGWGPRGVARRQEQMAEHYKKVQGDIAQANVPTDELGRRRHEQQVERATEALRRGPQQPTPPPPAPTPDVPPVDRIEPSPGAAANLGKPNELETVRNAVPLQDMSVEDLRALRAKAVDVLKSAEARMAEMEKTGTPILGSTKPGRYDLQRIDEVLRGKGYTGPLLMPAALTAVGAGGAALAGEDDGASLAAAPLAGVNPGAARALSRGARQVEMFAFAGMPQTPEMVAFTKRFPEIRPEHIPEAMENFKRWQGASQVTEPVYHGTTAQFDRFAKTRDIGFHFGNRAQAAEIVNRRTLVNKSIGEYQIRLENPLELYDLGQWNPDAITDAVREEYGPVPGLDRRSMVDWVDQKLLDRAGTDPSDAPSVERYQLRRKMEYRYIQDRLKEAGFDGIVYKNLGEMSVGGESVNLSHRSEYLTGERQGVIDNSYIVFDPTQIKSTKNLGTFDPTNPNVKLGLASAALGAEALTEEDQDGLAAVGLIVVAGGQVNPNQLARAARRAGRTVREAEALVKEATRGPLVDAMRQLEGHLLADELRALEQSAAARASFVMGAANVEPSETLAQAALAGSNAAGGYQRTTQFLVDTFGPDAPMVASIFAALSPQKGVGRNIDLMLQTYEQWVHAGRPTDVESVRRVVRGLPDDARMSAQNLVRVMTSSDPTRALSGGKVSNFAQNLAGDVQRVTNDTWMARLHGVDPRRLVRRGTAGEGLMSGQYLAINARTRETAERLTRETGVQWTPEMVQESQWGWVKDFVEQTNPNPRTGAPTAVSPNMPLEQRVLATDPARIRASWDTPRMMLAEPGWDILDRMGSAGELRGENIGRVSPWPELGRPDLPPPDPSALAGLAERNIYPALPWVNPKRGAFRWALPLALGYGAQQQFGGQPEGQPPMSSGLLWDYR